MSYHLPPPSAMPHSPRRPLTPTSLRDVNLSPNTAVRNFNYPAPPTGHELMALFPPNPPPAFLPGPTSGYFQSQERAFFSRAGTSSFVRVQIDLDMPVEPDASSKGKAKAIPITLTHRRPPTPWTPTSSPPQLTTRQMPSPPDHPIRSKTVPIIPVSAGPQIPKVFQPQMAESKMIIINDPDETWRRPIPYSERRRSGKPPKRRTE